MEKRIIYFGQKAKVACDGNCKKAWGINARPKVQVSDDDNDYYFKSDKELGDAPIDPGTYEGGHAKPTCKEEMMNKWCVRECERCSRSNPGMFDEPLELPDYSTRNYNIPRTSPSKNTSIKNL